VSDAFFDALGFACFALAAAGLLATTCGTGKRWGREQAWDHERTVQENAKCALRGLVLLRGQLGEFVCVTPGSERGRRKP
jgi:hypothetical protein